MECRKDIQGGWGEASLFSLFGSGLEQREMRSEFP